MTAIITWNATGDADTCDNCAALNGQTFTMQTLPDWPGSGSSGQDVLCLGGPLCRCTLSYSDDSGNTLTATNTLRESALAGDLSADTGPMDYVDQWIASRKAFTDALPDIVRPNEVYSTRARAVMRDAVRVQIARELGIHPADMSARSVAERMRADF